LTADYATHSLAVIRPESQALVHSAGGGVGLALIQTLKAQGHHVVGVVSSDKKADTVTDYGADEVIDTSSQDLWQEVERLSPSGYDLVFDPNGIVTPKQSYNHLAPRGVLFVYGLQKMLSKDSSRQNRLRLLANYLRMPRFDPQSMMGTNRGVMGFNINNIFDESDIFAKGFARVAENFQNGTFEPLPVTVYPFKEVARAHTDLQSGRTIGKLVLTHERPQ
jgi:synaptic vesicle membrane protein VAT-1